MMPVGSVTQGMLNVGEVEFLSTVIEVIIFDADGGPL